jgi:protein-tyrosine phosphatase
MLFILGAVCVVLGTQVRYWGWLVMWLGADFLIQSVAYFSRSHRVFGKRPDGTLPLWSWLLFFPYFVYINLVWNLARLLLREPAYNQVSPSLIVGRRLLDSELPSDIVNYVDLTTEFEETNKARQLPGYLSFPLLDASAPAPEELANVIASLKPGKTFVHCAQGHGRTGLFALALLVSSQTTASVDEGTRLLQSARPGVRLNGEQQRCVNALVRAASQRGGAK